MRKEKIKFTVGTIIVTGTTIAYTLIKASMFYQVFTYITVGYFLERYLFIHLFRG